MKHLFKGLFTPPQIEPTTEFSRFFHTSSSEEKKKLFREVLRKANEDQRELVKKYDELKTKTA